jgi:hypothetical protein
MKKEYRPMLATLVDEPFDSKEWAYETKWDGFRLKADGQQRPIAVAALGKVLTILHSSRFSPNVCYARGSSLTAQIRPSSFMLGSRFGGGYDQLPL